MELIRRFKIPIVVVFFHLLIVLWFSSLLPEDVMIPRQWDFQGEVGSYSGKAFGLWFLWGMSLFLLLIFMLFPHIDPRYKRNRHRFDELLPTLAKLMTMFMLVLHLYMLLWTLEIQLIKNYNGIMFLIGFLFVLLGNILPKIPSNFYAGIRSPWTLSSDTIWKKTHRFGGYCFVLSGFLMIGRGFYRDLHSVTAIIHLIVALAICMLPYLYSYLLYLKKNN